MANRLPCYRKPDCLSAPLPSNRYRSSSPISTLMGSWNPAQALQGALPDLYLRADQGVSTGGARQFYGADKTALRIADNAALSVTTQDFTVGLYVNFDSTGGYRWLVSKAGGGGTGYSIYTFAGSIYADMKTPAGSNITINGGAVSTGQWYFVLVEFDRDGNGTIYLNNVAGTPTSIAANSGSIDEAFDFVVGDWAGFAQGTYCSNCRVSRLFKTDRLLTTAEKTWLYNSGNGRLYGELGVAGTDGSDLLTNLKAYWNLNETSGTANAIDQHSTNDLVPTFAELLSNGGFETAGGGGVDVFGSWIEGTAGASTLSDETSLVHAGGHALKMTTVDSTSVSARQDVMTHAHRYTYSIYTRSAGGTEQPRLYLGNGSVIYLNETTSYVQNTATFTADASGNGNFYLYTSLAAGSVYFDSASLVAVDIPAADGPASDIASDSIGTTHGTLVNFASSATSWSSDRPTPIAALVDGSLAFDGTNDYVALSSNITSGTTFTVAMWIKPDSQVDSYGCLLGDATGTTGLYYHGSAAPGGLPGKISFFETLGRSSTTALANGVWSHVAISVSAGAITFFVNGVADGTGTGVASSTFNRIGDDSASQTFKGSISDIRIYTTALTAPQVAQLYAGTNYTTGLIARYKLDDGPQTGLVDGDPVVKWTSIEGGYHDFEQATASKRPLYRASAINSQPGIDFDGVDDLLVKASAFLTGTAGTVVIVYRLDAVPNTYQCLIASADEGTANKQIQFIGRGNTANPHLNLYWINGATADLLDGSTTVNVDTNYGGLFQSNGTAITAKLNGTSQTLNADTGANSGNWWDDATGKDNVTLGALKDSGGEGNFASGKICEIYVHPLNLTEDSLAIYAAYILARYGLAL